MSLIIRTYAQLEAYLATKQLSPAQAHLTKADAYHGLFSIALPTAYADLIDWTNPVDPLRLMVIPQLQEHQIAEYELADPIGDHDREAVPGMIHRYPDRVLLLLTTHCAIHCRFCFRKEVVGKPRPIEFKKIVEYLESNPQINELIFSGGDPFSFPSGFLKAVIEHLGRLKSIKTWRFHTRIPAVDPDSISHEWLELFKTIPAKKVVAIHINHPTELSPAAKSICQELLKMETLLLSQTVLLKAVNTSAAILGELFQQLVQTGVKPYYLHHLDKAYGTSHFRISVEEGKLLYLQLRGHLSSICLPEYVIDIPGGKGKIPVMWLQQISEMTYRGTSFEGLDIIYQDPSRSIHAKSNDFISEERC